MPFSPCRLARSWSVPMAVTLLAWSQSAAADCNDPFADPNQILDFHLETSTSTWAEFQDSEQEPSGTAGFAECEQQYPYFEARFRCGEEEWISIGFRRKRDRTESRFKLPIKLDFNRFVNGQRWPEAKGDLGFRRLTLNSGQPDQAVGGGFGGGQGGNPGALSALLTEHLAWRLMRAELPVASGSAYARLTVHFDDTGEEFYQGLYILIEDIDRTAVRARFGVDQGATYKTTDPSCVDEVVFEDAAANSATDGFQGWLALDPMDFPGSWYERTDEVLHLDELLRQEALRELLANTEDTILGRLNNYFAIDLYGRRRVYLPWDLDDVFRPYPQVHPADTPLVSSCTGGGNTCAPIPLGVNTRDNAEIRPIYLEAMCRASNGVAEEAALLSELDAIDALIRPVIAEEIPGVWQPQGLDPLDANEEGTYAHELERLREWIPDRVAAVREMIAAEGVPCQRGCEEGAVAACDVDGCSGRRSCTQGRWGNCQRSATLLADEEPRCAEPAPVGTTPAPVMGEPATRHRSWVSPRRLRSRRKPRGALAGWAAVLTRGALSRIRRCCSPPVRRLAWRSAGLAARQPF